VRGRGHRQLGGNSRRGGRGAGLSGLARALRYHRPDVPHR
jgi:hypothetical protein